MYGGCLTILEELPVREVWIAKQEVNSSNYQQFIQIIKNKNILVRIWQAGENLQIGKLYLRILWPEKEQIMENALNNNSLVLQLQYEQFSILFTGDIEAIAEEKMVQTYGKSLQSTILKVAHHGSKSSTIEAFVECVNPKIALIGVGENNTFGHPNEMVIQRLKDIGCTIYRTDKNGEIVITINNEIHIQEKIPCINQ